MPVALIVAVGWLYVTVLMAASQPSVLAALGTLLFYGLLPVALLMYLFMTPARRRRRREAEARAHAGAGAGHDGADASGAANQMRAAPPADDRSDTPPRGDRR